MLSVDALTASYGSAQVLNGATLALKEGEVVALLGRNGVGKTTLLQTIMGLVAPTGGRIDLQDRNVVGLATHSIARAGIGYVPQGRGIFDRLTVLENLHMGLRCNADAKAEIPVIVFQKFPMLKERQNQLAGSLSGGQKQQLAICRALCGGPRVLLLDEPSEGIQPNIVNEIGNFIRQLAAEWHIAVLLVEQNLDLARNAMDRFAMMDRGQIVHAGTPTEFRDEAMLKRYLSV